MAWAKWAFQQIVSFVCKRGLVLVFQLFGIQFEKKKKSMKKKIVCETKAQRGKKKDLFFSGVCIQHINDKWFNVTAAVS